MIHMSQKSVFLSYRRTDFAWAMAIYQDLSKHGFDVFLDYEQLSSGQFERVILENIRARAHFLVFLTPNALERCASPGDWLRREVEEAIDANRNIVPLLIHGFRFDAPEVAARLTGGMRQLHSYNGVTISPEYFTASMEKVRKFLAEPLGSIALAPLSQAAQTVADRQQKLAGSARPIGVRQLQGLAASRSMTSKVTAIAIAISVLGVAGWIAISLRPSGEANRTTVNVPAYRVPSTVKIEKSAWQPQSCDWTFRGPTGRDLISQGPNEILADGQEPVASDQVDCKITYAMPLSPPYAVGVTVYPLSGGGKGGITFNDDGSSFNYVELDAEADPTRAKVVVWKNGQWLGSATAVNLGFSERVGLKLEVHDDEVQVYINDNLVRSDNIRTTPGRRVGLRSAWSVVDFGEFSVTQL